VAETVLSRGRPGGILGRLAAGVIWLDRAPSWIYQLFFRLGLAFLFGYSGWSKLARWDNTLALFRDIYQVPVLAPEAAAVLATAVEATVPVLFLLGLGTRLAAAATLGMTVVIQLFVVPKGYHVHALWLGPILYLLLRGPGLLSIDHALRRRFMGAR
jgi:putative oxidoreductase